MTAFAYETVSRLYALAFACYSAEVQESTFFSVKPR